MTFIAGPRTNETFKMYIFVTENLVFCGFTPVLLYLQFTNFPFPMKFLVPNNFKI